MLAIQPPRGFGENPIAIYHDPALAPSHHYLATYWWLAHEFGAHAVVHLGKHGTLEWLPGKSLGLSASCAPDAVLGDLPLIYPFIVNDPGEGTQAKRRAHATIVDHLVPPMARADSYGDMAKLEQLLDEHATVAALDPPKLPAVRAQIWTLIQAAQLHHDLHIDDRPDDDEFDDFLLHVDGYLCEIKDAQIRDGLHILGQAPVGEARTNLVLAVLRAPPGLGRRFRCAARPSRGPRTGRGQGRARRGRPLRGRGSRARRSHGSTRVESRCCGRRSVALPEVARVLHFAATEVVPRLARTTDELTHVLHALNGGYVPAGPSGSPTRGLVNVLPTGRNFYSVDPKAIPSRLAWETGVALATSLWSATAPTPADIRAPSGSPSGAPAPCAPRATTSPKYCRCWGFGRYGMTPRAASRASRSCRSRSSDGPRVDVTVRISGFFRDAFPHVITLIDDAIQAVAELDEPEAGQPPARPRRSRRRGARRPAARHQPDLRLQARRVRRRTAAADRRPQLA